MNGATVSKTDFIKFNVSPTFKALAQKKARAQGMSLSELGRMLFGAFVNNLLTQSAPRELLQMAEEAKREHEKGKGTLIRTKDELESFLKTL